MTTYETPYHLVSEGQVRFNFKPILDVCATKENTKCQIYITKEQDAFKEEWYTNFFMNPPFNDSDHPLGEWVQRASEQAYDHNVSGMCLLPCYTDSEWWQKYIGDKMDYVKDFYFINKRVRFLVDGVQTKNKYRVPCVMVLL